ncbi:MAG: DUF423 domain-containing protein [Elusimicrobia bacterium]|nr:DUF423 domain-containing protein [Elusimicrobiota bacterium]MDE2511861.1 DUF423 domain-containing protein [Elusimicrobiota bacterium]
MFLAVGLGAFAAHGLKSKISPEMLAIWETGVRYHMYHALALIAVGLLSDKWPSRAVTNAGWCFLGGIVVFSGSLYVLSLTGERRLGAVTPIGGLLFLAGWALLLFARLK